MKISLITPANKHSKSGNRTSAQRWARFLREQGHQVRIDTDYNGEPSELMIALHAWRSADSVLRYRERYPNGPLIVALGGTDVNTFLKTEPEVTLRSMELADALVCLHDLIAEALPQHLTKKLHVIHQSAQPLSALRKPSVRHFDACVIGHLREEKDPFRTALAARLVPESSKLRVIHLGKAHSAEWEQRAHQEMVENPRYIWKGEVPKWKVRREFARTQLMVISSNQEGGANVISEAVVAGVPIIASAIPGNIGLLSQDYPGYYPVRDQQALAKLLYRAETEAEYLRSLEAYGRELRPMFTPQREAQAWANVITDITR